MSTRDTILEAFRTTLVNAGVASGNCYRSRQEQLPALPAVVINPSRETAEEQFIGVMDAELDVDVEIYANGDTPDNAADATLAAAHAALMADLSLGVADAQIVPRRSVDWQFENYDNARVTARYTVRFRTTFGAM